MVVVRSRTIGPLPAREAHVARLHHQPPRALGFLRLQAHAADALAARRPLQAERLERAHAPLVAGAAGLDAGADPGLFLRELLVEERPFAFLHRECRILALEVGVVVGTPVHQPAAVELHDAGGDATEERPVVRHEQERHAAPDEEVLHPLDGGDVEMVGGLVEQQQVGLAHEGAGQQRLALAPARGGGKRSIGVEAEVQQHRLHLVVHVPGARGVQRAVQPVEFAQRGVAGVRLHPVARLVIAREEPPGFAQARRHHVEDGALEAVGYLLLQSRNGDPRLPRDAAAVRHERAVQQLHQRALAGAVPAQEAHAFASLDREAGRIEHRRTAKRDGDILHSQQGHGELTARAGECAYLTLSNFWALSPEPLDSILQ